MDVIPFPMWRVHCFKDEHSGNVIRRWLYEQGISAPDKAALQSLIDIFEYSGPRGMAASIEDLGGGFHSLYSRRKGGPELALVFCYGPFSESEITILAAALVEDDRLKPAYITGIAEENLMALRKDPKRRTRESVT